MKALKDILVEHGYEVTEERKDCVRVGVYLQVLTVDGHWVLIDNDGKFLDKTDNVNRLMIRIDLESVLQRNFLH
jgi:hypothetical protein